MSDNYQRNGNANGQQAPQNEMDDDVTTIIFEYVLTQYNLTRLNKKWKISRTSN